MPNFTKVPKHLVSTFIFLAFLGTGSAIAQNLPEIKDTPIAVMSEKSSTLSKQYGPVRIEYLVNSVRALPAEKTGGQLLVEVKTEIEDTVLDAVSKNSLVVDGCNKGYGSLSIIDLGTKHSLTYVWAKEGEKHYDKMAQDVCALFEAEAKKALSSMGLTPGDLARPGLSPKKKNEPGI